jgi:septum site-determining protein MinC
VISGGNVHIYGDCRGRILAGVNGDKSAKIFANKFNAEFISIAGVYRVIEDKLPANLENKAVQIFLDDKERLNIVRL